MTRFNWVVEVDYDKQQLQCQLSLLKKQYSIFNELVDNSDFGWGPEKQIPTEPEEALETYVERQQSTEKTCYLSILNCTRYSIPHQQKHRCYFY